MFKNFFLPKKITDNLASFLTKPKTVDIKCQDFHSSEKIQSEKNAKLYKEIAKQNEILYNKKMEYEMSYYSKKKLDETQLCSLETNKNYKLRYGSVMMNEGFSIFDINLIKASVPFIVGLICYFSRK
jgi:hypothetical protein